MLSEFELISRYFTTKPRHTDLSVGDDAALLSVDPAMQCVVSTDMLVEGTHFLPGADPEALGHKTLAVNLSDLAAMGAMPRWAFLSLALPDADEAWVAAFARGFLALAQQFDVDLAGGDTTRGPRAFNVTILGVVPRGTAMLRGGARIDDDVWLSGVTGEAILGLRHRQEKISLPAVDAVRCENRLDRPEPRVALGMRLRGIASAAIDVSDGLAADLGHICEQSNVGAIVEVVRLPVSSALATVNVDAQRSLILTGGDDYELCFTAPPSQRQGVLAAAQAVSTPVTRIGRIMQGASVHVLDARGRVIDLAEHGFEHFR